MINIDCARIVPVKVKYFHTVPNETKNTMKNLNRINFFLAHGKPGDSPHPFIDKCSAHMYDKALEINDNLL